MTSFEKFLEEICFTIHTGVLDDDMSDFFDNWLSRLDGEDYVRYGQLYGEKVFLEGKEATLKALKN